MAEVQKGYLTNIELQEAESMLVTARVKYESCQATLNKLKELNNLLRAQGLSTELEITVGMTKDDIDTMLLNNSWLTNYTLGKSAEAAKRQEEAYILVRDAFERSEIKQSIWDKIVGGSTLTLEAGTWGGEEYWRILFGLEFRAGGSSEQQKLEILTGLKVSANKARIACKPIDKIGNPILLIVFFF